MCTKIFCSNHLISKNLTFFKQYHGVTTSHVAAASFKMSVDYVPWISFQVEKLNTGSLVAKIAF